MEAGLSLSLTSHPQRPPSIITLFLLLFLLFAWPPGSSFCHCKAVTATSLVPYSDSDKSPQHIGSGFRDNHSVPNYKPLVDVDRRFPSDDINVSLTAATTGTRFKRFDYEDHHEWPDDDSMDYDLDGEESEDDLTLVERIGKHWQTVAVRGLFFLVGLCMLILISCCCLKICCRMCCYSLRENCVPCGGFLKIISSYYEDPMYRKAKDLAELFGLKLDYDTYLKIKDRYDMGSEGPYNPLGLPHMAG